MQTRKIAPVIIGILGLICAQILPAHKAFATPDCSAGTTLNIVAHPDDDLFFINPKIKQDIDAGKCVETIYVTAGEGSPRDGDEYWQSRRDGIRAAYLEMIGSGTVDNGQNITVSSHTLRQYTFSANDRVSIVFLHLPEGADVSSSPGNGGDSLKKLWQDTISSATPIISGQPSYTKQDLIDVLRSRMSSLKPNVIRTLDYTHAFSASDHYDHTAVAQFAQAAQQDYTLPHQFIGHVAYDFGSMPENVTGDDLDNKLAAYYAYDPYDYTDDNTNSGSKCPDFYDSDSCDNDYENFLPREYEAASLTKSAHSFETMDGDSGSLIGNTGDTGQTPATVQFGSDLWVFYYDQTNGDLRYTKANSSTPTTWTSGALDTANNVGRTPTAVVHNNTLHVFYYDVTNTNLKHAWLPSGGSWQYENVDGDPGALDTRDIYVDTGLMPTVVSYGGSLQLFYYEPGTTDLRHAWSNSSVTSWSFETFDGSSGTPGNHSGNMGKDPHAVVFGGMLHVFYYDDAGDLRMSKTNPGWQFSVLDGDSTTDGRRNTTLGLNPTAAVYDGNLQVFYYDQTNGDLRHAWYNGTANWQFENLDGYADTAGKRSGAVGATPFVASDGTTLQVFAYDATRGDLRHYWTSTTQPWQAETLDGRGDDGTAGRINGDTGLDPVAIPFANSWHVFYYEPQNTNFRHSTL